MFHYSQLQKFHLLDSKLPEGSIIVDKPITFYEQHRAKVWIITILLALQSVVIFFLVHTVQQRKRDARELVRWGQIFENAQWGLAMGDVRTEKLISVNQAFARMHGCEVKDLINTPEQDVYAPEARPALAEHIREVHARKQYRFESIHLRKDGSFFPVAVNVATIRDERGAPLYRVVNVEDITARKATADKLQETMTRLAALNSLASKVVASLSLEEVARAALHELVVVTGVDFAILYVLEDGGLVTVDTYSRPPFSRKSDTEPHQAGVCLCGLAAVGRPVYSDDIHADARCSLMECKEAGLRSFAALPLLEGSKVIGVLGLASLKERRFSEEADFLETLAGQTALGIQNAILYDQLKQHAENQEEMVKERTGELEKRNSELERLNKLFVDREFRIKELRDEVAKLQRSRVTEKRHRDTKEEGTKRISE